VGNSHPILLGQNVTPQFLMSISTNILTVLANFLAITIQFFRKTSVMTTATLLLKGLHTDQHLRASSFTSLTSSLSPTISLDAATTLIDLEFPFSITDRPPPMDSLDEHLIMAYTCHPRAVPTNVSGWTRLAA